MPIRWDIFSIRNSLIYLVFSVTGPLDNVSWGLDMRGQLSRLLAVEMRGSLHSAVDCVLCSGRDDALGGAQLHKFGRGCGTPASCKPRSQNRDLGHPHSAPGYRLSPELVDCDKARGSCDQRRHFVGEPRESSGFHIFAAENVSHSFVTAKHCRYLADEWHLAR
jgi:hypothetical protein